MAVYVVDYKGSALMPCTERHARLLLDRQRARIHHVMPFVIRLIDRDKASCSLQDLRIKIDPGQ